MNPRSELHREQELVILTRMATTRAKLLAARSASFSALDGRRANALTPSNVVAAFARAPNVTLLAAIVLGSLIVGPRRIALVVVRSGLTGWIASTVRKLTGR